MHRGLTCQPRAAPFPQFPSPPPSSLHTMLSSLRAHSLCLSVCLFVCCGICFHTHNSRNVARTTTTNQPLNVPQHVPQKKAKKKTNWSKKNNNKRATRMCWRPPPGCAISHNFINNYIMRWQHQSDNNKEKKHKQKKKKNVLKKDTNYTQLLLLGKSIRYNMLSSYGYKQKQTRKGAQKSGS